MFDIKKETEEIYGKLLEWRRDFHRHPELSGQEVRTAGIVAAHLRNLGLRVTEQVGGTGVVGILEGGQPGRVLAMRADMDALPIDEATKLPYASECPGIMHACGHDGHTAMVMGAAEILARHRQQIKGTVKFIFQPAEEGGNGAARMVEAGVLENPRPQAIMAAHLAFWEAGTVAVHRGYAYLAADTFRIRVHGSGGHGCKPHECRDTLVAACKIVTDIQMIVARMVNPQDTATVSVGRISGGTKENIIPDYAELSGTVRTMEPEARERVIQGLHQVCQGVCKALGVTYELDYEKSCDPVYNDGPLMDLIKEASVKVLGEDMVLEEERCRPGSEDFSEYLKTGIPGGYLWVGGAYPGEEIPSRNHQPTYNWDEHAMIAGTAALVASAVEWLAQGDLEKPDKIEDHEPRELYRFFQDISAIPRVSGNEAGAAAYVVEVARTHGLWYYEDDLHNVLVRKPASPGLEHLPPVLLIGHLDMVGEKTADSAHDFTRDSLELVVEGNVLRANGTTLGADNGCGVAIMLKVLTDPALVHPPVECLFTVQEEVGLVGMEHFDVSHIRSRRAIGLDAGSEGVFRKGTTTKYEITSHFPLVREPVQGNVFRLYISGLKGGDQGAGIPLERICAIRMLFRVLHHMNRELDVRLISVSKPGIKKSIPECCLAYVALVSGEKDRMQQIAAEQQEQIRQEYAESDPGICVELAEAAAGMLPETDDAGKMAEESAPLEPLIRQGMLTRECSRRLTEAMYLAPYGARNRHLSQPQEVSCSVITKWIAAEETRITVFQVISMEEAIQGKALLEELRTYMEQFGFEAGDLHVSEGWNWERESPIRDTMVETYRKLFGKLPVVNISHGGNDCVVLKRKLPEMDMITTAATYVDYHTPYERLYMDTFERVCLLVEGTLRELAHI